MHLLKSPKLCLTQHLLSSGVFEQTPMRIIDAGVRGGAEPHWDVYGGHMELIGFEPDAIECERLNQSAKNTRARREFHYPIALYREKGTQTLYITKNRKADSFLRPNVYFVDRFPHSAVGTVVGTTEVQTTDIDSFLDEKGISCVDFMKIDVEGAELAVLDGANRLLSESLLGLSVEVFFQPYHIGEPLFADVDQYLRRFGFVLFNLEPERWRRKTLATSDSASWYGAGQIIWAQVLYLRDLVTEMQRGMYKPTKSSRIRVLKLASLAELFNLPDFAIELLQCARNVGLLNKKDVELMVSLIPAAEESHEDRQYSKCISVVKQIVRRCVPLSFRQNLRRLLETLLSS